MQVNGYLVLVFGVLSALVLANQRVGLEDLTITDEEVLEENLNVGRGTACVVSGNFPGSIVEGNFPNGVVSGNFPDAVVSGNFPTSVPPHGGTLPGNSIAEIDEMGTLPSPRE